MKMTALFFALCLTLTAQEAYPFKFFRLEFVLREFDDNKLVSSKNYTTLASTDERTKNSMRTGNKIPFQVGPNSTQFADVGVNIDVYRIQELNTQLLVNLSAEITTIPTPETANALAPHIRQNRWNATVTIPVGKATSLFSSDDLGSKRKLQLELTATPVK